ncbi:MAG: DUF6261 family protein [Capnocytophaga sp.]|nr:DUF6261 family protein [Capnocytophaga sp.]
METIKDVKTIRLEKLSIGEYTQFLKAVISLVEKATIEKVGISTDLFTRLQKQTELLTEIIGQSYISQETKELATIDKERSKLSVFLLSTFRVSRNDADTKKKNAATVLYNVCKNYVGLQSLPVRTKTQFISSMLNDLNKPANKTHIETLGVTASLTVLEKENQAYLKLSEGRAESQVANTFVSFKEVKKESNNLYKVLTKYAFATNLLHPTEESNNFITLLNKLIEDTQNANKQRLAQSVVNKKGSKPEETKPTEEEVNTPTE